MVKVGIIGGSGMESPELLKGEQEEIITTPYGTVTLTTGKIQDRNVVLLARHGKHHTIPPTQVNFRANISALKTTGCTHILATTAVGSLREEIDRGHLVILDQFIDFTRHRPVTFYETFEPRKPAHTSMAEPFSRDLREIFIQSCAELELTFHKTGTVVTIEGPRFSTKAESRMFRLWGADVINMSIAPECILANEAGIPYAAIAMSTDYDCWKEDEEPVTWQETLRVFQENVGKITNILIHSIIKI